METASISINMVLTCKTEGLSVQWNIEQWLKIMAHIYVCGHRKLFMTGCQRESQVSEQYVCMVKFMQIPFIFIYALKIRKARHQPMIVAILGKRVMRCSMFTVMFLYYMNFNNISHSL